MGDGKYSIDSVAMLMDIYRTDAKAGAIGLGNVHVATLVQYGEKHPEDESLVLQALQERAPSQLSSYLLENKALGNADVPLVRTALSRILQMPGELEQRVKATGTDGPIRSQTQHTAIEYGQGKPILRDYAKFKAEPRFDGVEYPLPKSAEPIPLEPRLKRVVDDE